MRHDLWRRAEELFHAALERPPEARRAFLDGACGEDSELRRQVEVLISKDEHAGSLLEKPVLADVAAALGARDYTGRLGREASENLIPPVDRVRLLVNEGAGL
jgi:hypothetical protein